MAEADATVEELASVIERGKLRLPEDIPGPGGHGDPGTSPSSRSDGACP
jgi:hypothetical protein